MKVKPLRCHSCDAPVAWYEVDEVGVPIVYCYNCFENEHMEQGEYVMRLSLKLRYPNRKYVELFSATIKQRDGWVRWVG
ncbi:MAG: hypothetical protein WCF23_19270 [Candidatus Nitrosopolaris sp.]